MSARDCHHPVFARLYAWVSSGAESHGVTDHRRELLEGLSGRVLEVGAGNGLNFALYPESVAEVVALEPEPYLRRFATRKAAAAPVRVTVVDGLAELLPYDDGSFDGAVASLVLCSVVDPDRTLAELHRVLRPGGELRFYEHVRAQSAGLGRVRATSTDSGPSSPVAVTAIATHLPRSSDRAFRSSASGTSRFQPACSPDPSRPT